MTEAEKLRILEELAFHQRTLDVYESRTNFYTFCRTLEPGFYTEVKVYLKTLCDTLQLFYEGRLLNDNGDVVKGLMIRMPPQTGKSRTLINFCKWVYGQNQNERIITASYSDDTASDFSRYTRDGIREVKNMPDQVVFSDVFPKVKIKSDNASVQKWALEGQHFSYLGVGAGGGVTGKGATIRIIDDLVKDAEAALSKVNQDRLDLWLNGTFSSRNAAEEGEVKEIFCATLWTKNDPQYRLQQTEPHRWYVLQFEAYDEKTGKMLCDSVMSRQAYLDLKARMLRNEFTKLIFWANYHSRIMDLEGALYKNLKTYDDLPPGLVYAYVDSADTGDDYLCAIAYIEKGRLRYVKDVYYTTDPAEVTEGATAEFLGRNAVNKCKVESNAGGRAFARNVERICREEGNYKTSFEWFHQSKNKLARIVSNSSTVCNTILFPQGWNDKWPEFYDAVTTFLPNGKGHDDACFIAGTKIATLYGLKNIEDIPIGEMVITPFGVRKVTYSGCTGVKNVITNIGITGTKNHKVFYKNRFDVLTGIDEKYVSLLSLKNLNIWRYKKLLCSMRLNTDLWGRENIILVNQTLIKDGSVLKDFMLQFGSFITGKKYRKAFVFTIKTVTLSIMTSVIWSAFQFGNILANTLKITFKIQNLLKTIWRYLMRFVVKQVIGIEANQGENGIVNTQNPVSELKRNFFARIAGVGSNLFFLIVHFVVKNVGNNTEINTKESHTPRNVNIVGMNLLQQKSNKANRKGDFVQEVAQIEVGQKVYNITVEKDGCYYANGILVSNCDVLTGIVETVNTISYVSI